MRIDSSVVSIQESKVLRKFPPYPVCVDMMSSFLMHFVYVM